MTGMIRSMAGPKQILPQARGTVAESDRTLYARTRPVAALVLFFYILVYELVFFNSGVSDVGSPIWFFKLGFPFLLLLWAMLQHKGLLARSPTSQKYTVAFIAFISVALMPSVAVGGAESIVSWSRYAIRLVYCTGLIMLLDKDRRLLVLLAKLAVIWAVASVAQYLLLIIGGQHTNVGLVLEGRTAMAGPMGLLGNVNSFVEKSTLPISLVRLCGFWLEPSNASAFLFASFYLAKFVAEVEGSRIWRLFAFICFFGGTMCMSNAGFSALGAAILCGAVIKTPNARTRRVSRYIMLCLGVTLVCFGLLGRWIVATHVPGLETAAAITGVKTTGTSFDTLSDWDYTEGRADLLLDALQSTMEQPFGIGVRVNEEQGWQQVSASAPFFWLKFTGIAGFVALLFREWVVISSISRHRTLDPARKLMAQAWVVVLVQNLSYGTWMSPLYLTLTAGLLALERVPLSVPGPVRRRDGTRLPLVPVARADAGLTPNLW